MRGVYSTAKHMFGVTVHMLEPGRFGRCSWPGCNNFMFKAKNNSQFCKKILCALTFEEMADEYLHYSRNHKRSSRRDDDFRSSDAIGCSSAT